MKDSKRCPKCNSNDIVVVPGTIGPYGGGNHIPLGNKMSNAVLVTRYVCLSCGYTEEWIDTPQDRQQLKEKYYKESF
ncbi:hypothetical protein lbkm_1873 [Lachnospiraceae bacterium KM106-2]|nr:hypothetical protein lbkm_1873 [Lachnospiraceae bacterium KM106-2]